MKRKLLALWMAVAMLASLCATASAGEATNSGGAVTTYSYSNTSDALTIVNKSNIDVKVELDVQFTGMSNARFVSSGDVTTTASGGVVVTPAKSLYVALLVSGDSALPVQADGTASVTKTLPKAEDGAYKWKVTTASGGGKEYVYELDDALENDDDADEFSRMAFKLTGAVSKTGWENDDANFQPSLTVKWKCTTSGDSTNSGGQTTNSSGGTVTPTTPTVARIAYNGDLNGDGTAADDELIYWDTTAKKFYTTSDGTTEYTDATQPTDAQIGADNKPIDAYLTTAGLTEVVTGGQTTGSGDSRFNAFNKTYTNQVTFEGSAPPEMVAMVVPTDADNAFKFILDPNGRIQATEAAIYDGAHFEYGADTDNPSRLFFRNASTGDSSASGNSGNSGNSGAAAYTGAKATIETAASATNQIITITVDVGDSGMTKISRFQCTNSTDGFINFAPTAGHATYDLVSNTQLDLKAIPAVYNSTQSDWKIVLSDGGTTNTLTIPIDIKTAGVYTPDGPLS